MSVDYWKDWRELNGELGVEAKAVDIEDGDACCLAMFGNYIKDFWGNRECYKD